MAWQINDLTQSTGAPMPRWSTAGYVNVTDNSQRILYVADNFHVVELRYTLAGAGGGGSWARAADLTTTSSVPPGWGVPCPIRQSLFLNVNVPVGQPNGHVIYRGREGETLYWLYAVNGSEYLAQDVLGHLTSPPDVDAAPSGDAPCAFLWPGVGSLHGVYVGKNGTVHEVQSSGDKLWTHVNISTAVPGLPPAASDPVGLVMFDYPPGQGQSRKHLFYADLSGHVQHLSAAQGAAWTHDPRPLDVEAGAPQGDLGRGPVPPGGRVTAWAFNPPSGTEDTLHLVYRTIRWR